MLTFCFVRPTTNEWTRNIRNSFEMHHSSCEQMIPSTPFFIFSLQASIESGRPYLPILCVKCNIEFESLQNWMREQTMVYVYWVSTDTFFTCELWIDDEWLFLLKLMPGLFCRPFVFCFFFFCFPYFCSNCINFVCVVPFAIKGLD